MHENDDIKNEKNPQFTISLTELTLMSFACRWINVHLIIYNIFSAFLLNDWGYLIHPHSCRIFRKYQLFQTVISYMFHVVLTLTSTLTHYFTSNHDKFISMSTIYCYRSNTLKFRSMKNNSAFNKSIQLPEGLSTVRNIKHLAGNQDNLSFITFQI